jgi:hypothetical protein
MAAGLEEFMDDFAHNNTDVCCLVAFAHWRGEDHMPFLYWVNCVMHWMYADDERKNCLFLLVSPFSRNF